MSYPLLDTDIIIRLLTGDDPAKQARARTLFERIERGELAVAAPVTVIADAVYVLSSPRLYKQSRQQVAALLTPLVRLPGLHIQSRRAVLRALELFGTTTDLDFGDAMLAALAQQSGNGTIYSYDRDFDGLPGVTREEP